MGSGAVLVARRARLRTASSWGQPGRKTATLLPVNFLIKEYGLEQGALEIQYIEEYFGEFPRRKTAEEVVGRLRGREHSILITEAPLPEDPAAVVPVAYKVSHELRAEETEPKLADLVGRLSDVIDFASTRVLYSWIGGTRRDWRAQGQFRALTEEQEAWALGHGFHLILVKTKNQFYDMRSTLDALQFDVVKFEPHPDTPGESKVYLAKALGAEVLRQHRSRRTVVRVD